MGRLLICLAVSAFVFQARAHDSRAFSKEATINRLTAFTWVLNSARIPNGSGIVNIEEFMLNVKMTVDRTGGEKLILALNEVMAFTTELSPRSMNFEQFNLVITVLDSLVRAEQLITVGSYDTLVSSFKSKFIAAQ